MTTLYSFGTDPTRWYSRSTWSSTSDGISWTTGVDPVQGLGSITTLAHGGTQWVGATNYGQFTVSNNLTNWYNYDAENKLWLVNKISYGNGIFVAVGHEKNQANLAETGFIAVSATGAPASWARTWVSYDAPVCLFDVKHISGNRWIAVGSANDLEIPVMLYSTDNAQTWQQVSLPSSLQGGIYSLTTDSSDTERVWIGGRGWVASTNNWQINNTVWSLNDQLFDQSKRRPITRLYYRNSSEKTTVVALTGSTAWFSSTGTVWSSYTQPGYRFLDCVNFHNNATGVDTLYLSAGGLMQQYSGFKTTWSPQSTSPLVLTGFNNGVQATAQIVV